MSRLSFALAALAFAPTVYAQDRQAAAETAFDAVMQGNTVNLDNGDGGGMAPAALAAPRPAMVELPPVASGEAIVPLLRYEALREQLRLAAEESRRSYATLVVLGGSTYTGRATPGGLELHLSLTATLTGDGFWKSVPIVGENVAIVHASVGGEPVALTNQSGYQVWVTDEVGEVTLEVDVLVPTSGPRGSQEYDFYVPRTPVTRFDCTFPGTGIEPEVEGAVRTMSAPTGSATTVSAWLLPTSRIHVVGLSDLGGDEAAARLYVETLSLLSIEEHAADLFTVLRYTILGGAARQFDVLVPPGLSVVEADGAGGFRYTTESTPAGTVLHGETAFPIRDAYEVSLRLKRTLDGATLDVVPPRALGVEREHGWLGLEVVGTVQVEPVSTTEAVAVDVGQLPGDLLGNAVTPVLDGWRYHSDGASVRLSATPLPEREPAAGSVDALVATTTVTPEGRARTDLSITLRNRLRHSLTLTLPAGAEVSACRLDGVAVTPSKNAAGQVVIPLKRSAGVERPLPFTLEVTLLGDVGAFGAVGAPELWLPQVELPVSRLEWTVNVPAHNRYTGLFGQIGPQVDETERRSSTVGDTTQLRYSRFWIAADQPVSVRFGYLRGWLAAPLALLAAIGVGLATRTVRRRWPAYGERTQAAAVLGLVGVHAVLWAAVGFGAAAVAALGSAWSLGVPARALAALTGAWAELRQLPAVPAAPGSFRARGLFGKLVLLACTAAVAVPLGVLGLRIAWLLGNPL